MQNIITFSDPQNLTQRLTELNLDEKILREAVERGQAAWNGCTANDPPGLPGIIGWGRTNRSLRDQLLLLGWKKSDRENYSITFHEGKKIAIAVATGDEGTGRPQATPKTKYPKGPATRNIVDQNVAIQLSFDNPDFAPIAMDVPIVNLDGYSTWLLLISRGEDEVRCELSLPFSIGEDGKVEAWRERIILTPVELSPAPHPESMDFGADIDVLVERKSPGSA